MNKRLIPLIVFAVLAVFFAIGLTKNPREVPSPFINKPAPSFMLPVVGEPQRMFSPEAMQGQVWLLNIWAPWCVSCRQEHPVLMELRASGIKIVGLNWKDKAREAASLLASVGNPYVVAVDDLDGRVGIDYGVTGTPETFVVDKTGVIRLKHVGPIDARVWEKKIAPLMKELGA